MDITYTNFDWAGGTADMIGNGGTAKVQAWRSSSVAESQFIFLERTFTGNVTLTSVFLTPVSVQNDKLVKGTQAYAVHSRHIALPTTNEAEAMASQMTGICGIKL